MRSETKRGKLTKRSIRIVTLIVALTLILGAAVGVAIAYLTSTPGGVVNTFNPGVVTGVINEEFDLLNKKEATVENTGNVDAYVRVAVVGVEIEKDEDDNIVVIGSYDVSSYIDSTNWQLLDDGYYYYKGIVAPGDETPNLLVADTATTTGGIPLSVTEGSGDTAVTHYYQVSIVAELIQAEGQTSAGADAVTDAWGVTYSDGTWAVAGN